MSCQVQLERWLSLSCSDRKLAALRLEGIGPQQSVGLAEQIASWYRPGSPLCLFLEGPIGVGKTHFSKALIAHLTGIEPEEVASPTYSYLLTYDLPTGSLLHFDLYRLNSQAELQALDLDELWQAPTLSLIEWPAAAKELAPWPRLTLQMEYTTQDQRAWSCSWQPTQTL